MVNETGSRHTPVRKGVSKRLIGVKVPPRVWRELERLRKRTGKKMSPFCEDILTRFADLEEHR